MTSKKSAGMFNASDRNKIGPGGGLGRSEPFRKTPFDNEKPAILKKILEEGVDLDAFRKTERKDNTKDKSDKNKKAE